VSPSRPAECEDLRLLIGLMHSGSGYCEHEGRALSLAEVVRLLVLGGKLQVEACVAQCVDKLKQVLCEEDPGPAMELLESVPSEMDGRKDVEALRNLAFFCLVTVMESKGTALTNAGRAWGIVVSFIEEKTEGDSLIEAQAWNVLDDVLESKSLGDEIKGKVGTAVARYLGPVHRLWSAGPWTDCCWSAGLSSKAQVRFSSSQSEFRCCD
jgi:hypothetical protein